VTAAFLSCWHVYAFTSNRSVTICNIAIEKLCHTHGHTQLPLLFLFNKIDHIALVYVRSSLYSRVFFLLLFFSFVLSSNRSFFGQTECKKKKRRRVDMYKYASERVVIMTFWLFVSSLLGG